MGIATKKLISTSLLALIFFFGHSYSVRTEELHFPINRGSEITRDLARYDGELVAVELRILDVTEKGLDRQTYIKAEFPDHSTIWLAAIGKIAGSFDPGDVIRVLGYISAVPQGAKETLAINNAGWHIISVCYYNFRTKQETRFKFSREPNQCSNWRNGRIGNTP